MIVLTRLNDARFAINPDLIERIHSTPDTTLVMVDGAKYIVTETLAEVIELIAAYRARVISMARDIPAGGGGDVRPGPALGLVPGPSNTPPSGGSRTDGGTAPLRPRKM
ncbi:flagellar FlbD family protein [Arthrobacter sp. ATA002]|uniref:flagellar FlbD family protein n=1 Tax=Arthrobacter sp. ATA002 TaxID=2991715 RepID=UPI0022A76140|nr:flagellar FlbD family protein [Arthrobacter sp. ATA002]WAP51664.1 flagellar FlbD family protein [Arthrobacter sp. ATA002]